MVLEYRLYYDENGIPYSMASNNHPDGNYIVITKEHYDSGNYKCKVVNGKLVFIIDNPTQFHIQLKKSEKGMPVVRGHANLVVENGEYKDIEYYDRNN